MLWIGTSAAGVFRYDGVEFESFFEVTRSTGEMVLAYGLLGYDGQVVTIIDTRDGLAGNQVFTVKPDANGSLWLGTLDGGLTHYRRGTSAPGIRLRGIKVDGETVAELSQTPVPARRRLVIQYSEIDLKTHPDKRRFLYRLTRAGGEQVASAVTGQR